MKIVINRCHGSFGLSHAGMEYYYRLKGITEFFYYLRIRNRKTNPFHLYKRISPDENELSMLEQDIVCILTKDFGSEGMIDISSEDFQKYHLSDYHIDRIDEDLIKTVTDLGEKANNMYSQLVIVEIPDDVQWQINEYDGVEWVAKVHRRWGDDL